MAADDPADYDRTKTTWELLWRHHFTAYGFPIVIAVWSWLLLHGYHISEPYNDLSQNLKGLDHGWIGSRLVDASDHQWYSWRNGFPKLLLAMMLFALGSNAVKYFAMSSSQSAPKRKSKASNESPYQVDEDCDISLQIAFYNVSGLLTLYVLHGNTCVYLVACILVNYAIAHACGGSRWNPTLTWLFNLAMLIASDYFQGFHLAPIFGDWAKIIDDSRGILDWEIYYKMSLLRFISFNLDYYWMLNKTQFPVELEGRTHVISRMYMHLPSFCFRLHYMVAYVLYVPLYIAGPILNFSAFISQVAKPVRCASALRLVGMLAEVIVVMIGIDVTLHYIYYVAFNQPSLWPTFRPYELMFMGLFTGNFMYAKFLVIWRFFRTMALFDDIDTPENMGRCVNNNYTFIGFWRSWHGSFNKWTIKYMYLPMGGWKTRLYSIWVIFFFVGMWHDLWWEWIAWALLNCCFISIEVSLLMEWNKKRYDRLRDSTLWSYVQPIVAGLNIMLLIVSNLSVLHGFSGTRDFLINALMRDGSLKAFFWSVVFLALGNKGMYLMRRIEQGTGRAKPF